MATMTAERRAATANDGAARTKNKAPTVVATREKQEARNGRCDFCLQRGGTQALDLGGYRMVACQECGSAIARRDVSTLVHRAMQGSRISESSHPGSVRRLKEDYGFLLQKEGATA